MSKGEIFSRVILISVIAVCSLYIYHNAGLHGVKDISISNWVMYYGFPGIVILMLVIVFFRSVAMQGNVSILIISLIISLYMAEMCLYLLYPNHYFYRDGVKFDSRTKIEVIASLRRDGVEAYPFFQPYWFVR